MGGRFPYLILEKALRHVKIIIRMHIAYIVMQFLSTNEPICVRWRILL
jgi:hypothetical protein